METVTLYSGLNFKFQLLPVVASTLKYENLRSSKVVLSVWLCLKVEDGRRLMHTTFFKALVHVSRTFPNWAPTLLQVSGLQALPAPCLSQRQPLPNLKLSLGQEATNREETLCYYLTPAMASRPRRDAGPRQEQAASSHCPEAASVSLGCQEGGSLMGRGGPGAERCKSRGRAGPGRAAQGCYFEAGRWLWWLGAALWWRWGTVSNGAIIGYSPSLSSSSSFPAMRAGRRGLAAGAGLCVGWRRRSRLGMVPRYTNPWK